MTTLISSSSLFLTLKSWNITFLLDFSLYVHVCAYVPLSEKKILIEPLDRFWRSFRWAVVFCTDPDLIKIGALGSRSQWRKSLLLFFFFIQSIWTCLAMGFNAPASVDGLNFLDKGGWSMLLAEVWVRIPTGATCCKTQDPISYGRFTEAPLHVPCLNWGKTNHIHFHIS